jgi:hypothetical protein
MTMPQLDRDRVLALIRDDRRFRGDVRKVAELINIPYGTLRNAIGCGDQMRYSRVSMLAEALLVAPGLIMADEEQPSESSPQGKPGDGDLAAAS